MKRSVAVGIVGKGFVGRSHAELFRGITTVCAFDKNPARSDVPDLESLVETVASGGVVFVAVNTPMDSDGACDTSGVESVVRGLNDAAGRAGVTDLVVCIKSTCVPGTTRRLGVELRHVDVVFSPEFLTEAAAMDDLLRSNRVVIGGYNPRAVECVASLYGAALPKATILRTGDPTVAELVKYITNTFLALKVAFANEIYEIAEWLDLDYREAIGLAGYDPRLGRSHWTVPGPDGARGFGGHCFPKDLNALLFLARQAGLPHFVLQAAWDTNRVVRAPSDRDWERQLGRAVSFQARHVMTSRPDPGEA